MKHPKQQPKSRIRYLIALNVILVTLWVTLRPGRTTSPTTATAATATISSATRAIPERLCAKPDILFTCPDGRRGLHIVHTRFLVSQAKANLLFQSTRLQLLNTFFIPSLRAQNSKKFVLYASYDPDLSKNVVSTMEAALKLTEVHVLINPERHTSMALNYSQIATRLKEYEAKVDQIDIYITSRLDIDDTTHVGSVEAIQKFACSGREPTIVSSKDGEARGNDDEKPIVYREPPPIRVAYIQGGQLWFPSKKSSRPYGEVGIWKTWKERVYDDIYKFLAIMQSMIITDRNFILNCQSLTVYGYPHYRPEALANISGTVLGCPTFEFKPDIKRTNKYMLLWDPPAGDLGNLYVRTASSWSHDQIDLHYSLESTNVTVLERSFGIVPAELAAANLLFSGFEQRTASLLLNNSDIPIEK
jgi:hypothetical protein